MSEMKQIHDIRNRCKHFTGIHHDVCKADVPYEQFRKPSGALVPLPCFRDERGAGECDKAEWYTEPEAIAINQQHELAIKEYFANLESGKCHICKIPVAQRQVGHCVYGSCGHRLYQGKVNPKFKQVPP